MISRFERGAFRFTCDIPQGELKRIARELRIEMNGSYFRRRRIREMVVWDADGIIPVFGPNSSNNNELIALMKKINPGLELAMPKHLCPDVVGTFTHVNHGAD